MKIATILGTRPEIIKMAPVIDAIRKNPNIESHDLIHTGQHYDYQMSESICEDIFMKPNWNLLVKEKNPTIQVYEMMKRSKVVLDEINPDLILVQGDTNSALAGALVGAKENIPVGHVEAGLRSYDRRMPEELNRILIDHSASINFPPTDVSKLNLYKEGIVGTEPTGNTIVDSIKRNLHLSYSVDADMSGDWAIVTIHRQENVNNPIKMRNIINALDILANNNMGIIFPVHPRTELVLRNYGLWQTLEDNADIVLTDPMGYLEFLYTMNHSMLIITDSGGLQEEAITLKVPCVTLRDNTERPETLVELCNILVGTETKDILSGVELILDDKDRTKWEKNPYGDGHAARRIVGEIFDA